MRALGIALGNLGRLREKQARMEEARANYEEALAIQRAAGDSRMAAGVLASLARLELLTGGDVDRADALASEGECLFRDLADPGQLCSILAIRGHLALARSRSASAILDEARKLVAGLGVRAESPVAVAVDGLARAEHAFASGVPLLCGHVAEELSEEQRAWLREHRPERFAASLSSRQ